jgi:hypothetical protein
MTVAEVFSYVQKPQRKPARVHAYKLKLDGVTIATHYAREDSDAVEYFAEAYPDEFSYSDSTVERMR